jgi:hypothetical protein
MRALRGLALAALLAGSLVALSDYDRPAQAQEGHCVLDPVTLNCQVQAPVPGAERPDGGGGDNGGTGSSGNGGEAPPMAPGVGLGGYRSDCTWRTVTGSEAAQARQRLANAPTDGEVQVCEGGPGGGGGGVRVVPPGAEAPPPPPDPAEVAADLFAEVQARMTAPEVVADPPVGTPSIITLPVFVQVTNWVDGFEVDNCVQGVCVNLTAEPTLTFDPGEPGSEPIVCDPPGTRFDPNGADPAVQAAAPGACAYAYQARTGADDRPEAWRGVVTITWNVAWTAGDAGDTFPPYPLSTVVPREVDEVQTVVRD